MNDGDRQLIKLDTPEKIDLFLSALAERPEWENLLDKTQVFNDRKSNKVKSRGAHSLDVGKIASELVTLLRGGEANLTAAQKIEAARAFLIGQVHDIGHIPFGHAGESVADKIIKEYYTMTDEERAQNPERAAQLDAERAQIAAVRESVYGTEYTALSNENKEGIQFEHNENSVLQLIMIANELGFEIDQEIITGILAHSTSRYKKLPQNVSQQAVRIADKLAYINYDVQDLLETFRSGGEKTAADLAAVEAMYQEPIPCPDGGYMIVEFNPSTGKYSAGSIADLGQIKRDGTQLTVMEFLTTVPAEDRIAFFIEETVRDAEREKNNTESKFSDYETILTGCNDVLIDIKEKGIGKEDGNKMLYRRSPALYLAYKIKEKSDGFIQAGKHIPVELLNERADQALSPVGNKDMLNMFIYKTIINNIKNEVDNNKLLSFEQIQEKYNQPDQTGHLQTIGELFMNYRTYAEREKTTLTAISKDGKEQSYPDIVSIVNFVGTHSNEKMNEYAEKLGLVETFNREVLPEINTITHNENYFDRSTGTFSKEGRKAMQKIVMDYAAVMALRIGIERNELSPLTSEETKREIVEKNPYVEVEGYTEPELKVEDTKTEEEKVAEFEALKGAMDQESLRMAAEFAQQARGGQVR